MKKKIIEITQINDLIKLVSLASKVEGDVTISRGKYVIDGKSIMGLLSIDVSNGVLVEYPEDANEFGQYILQFEKIK